MKLHFHHCSWCQHKCVLAPILNSLSSLFLSERRAQLKDSYFTLYLTHLSFWVNISLPLAKKASFHPNPPQFKDTPLPCEWTFCHTWSRQRQQGQSWDHGISWSACQGAASGGRFYHNGYRHKAFLQYGSVCAWPCAAPGTTEKTEIHINGYRKGNFQLKQGQNFMVSIRKSMIL